MLEWLQSETWAKMVSVWHDYAIVLAAMYHRKKSLISVLNLYMVRRSDVWLQSTFKQCRVLRARVGGWNFCIMIPPFKALQTFWFLPTTNSPNIISSILFRIYGKPTLWVLQAPCPWRRSDRMTLAQHQVMPWEDNPCSWWKISVQIVEI